MLAYNPKIVKHCAGDQAILSLVFAVSEHARPFYQRAKALLADTNIRRYFTELDLLHQQARKLIVTENTKVVSDQDINTICQWYRYYNAELNEGNKSWMAELPQQLERQLIAFKRLSRELTHPNNAKALANLTAGLQIIADQLSPILNKTK